MCVLMNVQMTTNVTMRTEAVYTFVKTITVTTPAAAMKAFTWRLTPITA